MLKQTIKAVIKRTLFGAIDDRIQNFQDDINRNCQNVNEYIEWLELGKPAPPPNIIKQITVKIFANKYRPKIFIETGTYLGDMVYAVKSVFDKIYSIELGDNLYERARIKFSKYNHISILHGDSAVVLPEILHHIDEPCLFWLDAHYSAGNTAKGELVTPIFQELDHIFNHPAKVHVILIDDARDFDGNNDYPTIQDLRKFVLSRKPEYEFDVENDIIRLYKSKN